MAEGDTVFLAGRRLDAALKGKELIEVRSPSPRAHALRAEGQLLGATLTAARTHGKNLHLDFDNGLSVYSHMRVNGAWDVYPRGSAWRRRPAAAWLVLGVADAVAVQFGGPVLEIKRTGKARLDPRITALGPDLLAPGFSVDDGVAALRAADPHREVGDVLLDQRVLAGLGNVLKSEACFEAGVDPWRRLADLGEEELEAVARASRRIIRASVSRGPRARRPHNVYNRAGRRCFRCGTAICSGGQGDANRTTYWCPSCQV